MIYVVQKLLYVPAEFAVLGAALVFLVVSILVARLDRPGSGRSSADYSFRKEHVLQILFVATWLGAITARATM